VCTGAQCMPCSTKPEFSTWTGIADCDFKCQDGTQNVNGRCVPCETTKPVNATWLSNCRWSCEPGLRVVEGKCSPCALQKPINSSWVPGADCKWECGGGFQLAQGDCAKCSDGKDFRSRWTQGCNWECNAGYTRSETGCAPCAAKDAQSSWASDTGCVFVFLHKSFLSAEFLSLRLTLNASQGVNGLAIPASSRRMGPVSSAMSILTTAVGGWRRKIIPTGRARGCVRMDFIS
jgi:hypothetical protein